MNATIKKLIYSLLMLSLSSLTYAMGSHPDSNGEAINIGVNVDVPVPEIITELSNAISKYAEWAKKNNKETYIDDLEEIRFLLAKLSGQEFGAAKKLQLGIQNAIDRKSNRSTQQYVNAELQSARLTFSQLKEKINPIKTMPGVNSELLGGLHCLLDDSVLFGYDKGGCHGGQQLFGAGRVAEQNNKAKELVNLIIMESKYILELSSQIGEVIDDSN